MSTTPTEFPDRWGWFTSPRGKAMWHLWRHVESTSGGTYGWWPICQAHVHQSVGPMETADVPPAGDPVCRTCKRGGRAKWEDAPQAADWIFGGIL